MRLSMPTPPLPAPYPAEACIICGCTEARACPGGCAWAAPRLCTACVAKAAAILEAPAHTADAAERPARELIAGESNMNLIVWCLRHTDAGWRETALMLRLQTLADRCQKAAAAVGVAERWR